MAFYLKFIVLLFFALPHAVLFAVDFESEIEPILKSNCFECHGEEKQKGKLRLDRLSSLLKGGDIGEAAIVPGNPAGSFLIKAIKHEESGYEMPPKTDKLSRREIELLETWIREGAKTPESYGPATEKVELKHWSFLPVKKSDAADSIDGFVQLKLKENGLLQSPEADRRTLIRRLYLVMLGLPPTPEEIDSFLADKQPDAWERLVEKTLASQHYGERWASHWLDLVRFGETHGFEMNRERPTAWPYRDWVIEAFNADKPYDEFVREQIAGDALESPVAPGFLVAGPWDQVKGQDPSLRIMQRMNELDDMINTTGTAFLGLTTGCARCHNHKFDPISQRDYYAMQAVFAGVNHGDTKMPLADPEQKRLSAVNTKIDDLKLRLAKFIPETTRGFREAVNAKHNIEKFPGRSAKFIRFTIVQTSSAQPCLDELEIYSGGKNIALASLGAKPTSSGDFKHELHKLEHINDGKYGNARSWIAAKDQGWVQIELPTPAKIDRIEWARDREGNYADRLPINYRIESALEPGKWETLASSDDRLPADAKETSRADPDYQFTGKDSPQGRQWHEQLKKLVAEKEKLEKPTLIYAGKYSQPGPTHRLYRGEPEMKREEVAPNAIAAFTSLELGNNAPDKARRLAFANWVADPKNPLTARVIVNRIWQFHFGTGIVDTPSDLGRNGTAPTHPELLDWLAAELVENQWSLKHIHRLILTSATWRQSNRPIESAMKLDAASRLLWRFPSRRLEAEGIRDSILSVSGAIDLEMRGGPGFSPFKVKMENVRHYYPKESYGPEDWRRMIYMTKVRQEREHVFGAFDCPDASQTVAKRSRSTTPLQALNLLNSSFVIQQAEFFAERLENEHKQREAQIQRAWELCFGRLPTEVEVSESLAFIEAQGIKQFTRAMLNMNEFVFIP